MATEPTNLAEALNLSQVIQIDERKIPEHLGEVVRSTVDETLNVMLDVEADLELSRTEKENVRIKIASMTLYSSLDGVGNGNSNHEDEEPRKFQKRLLTETINFYSSTARPLRRGANTPIIKTPNPSSNTEAGSGVGTVSLTKPE